ncbi:MAG: type VI secretion system tip protein VgrG [Variovorax sp.]|nr:MAG: type VI secretion system tip protein VgrG [Variovorax sp.]
MLDREDAASGRTLEARWAEGPESHGWQAVRLSGREGVNSLFAYELVLKAPESLEAIDVDLDAWVGREIGCRIRLDGADPRDSGVRGINAIVAEAHLWGEEGRHVQVRLALRPWLHLATLRTDCRIFQDRTVVDILDELLAGYGFAVDKRLVEHYPVRDFQTQFNETDFAFFSRLCAEWGINYHFEHDESFGVHRLVLADAMGAYRPMPSAAHRSVDYHAPGWKTEAEYLHGFTPRSTLASGRYATRDYDYQRPRADLSVAHGDPRATAQADGEVYRWHADSHWVQPDAGAAPIATGASPSEGPDDPHARGRRLALLRMQALRTSGARAQARGNLRALVPGGVFRLAGHPREAANVEHLVIEASLLIEDVAQDSQRLEANDERRQRWQVRTELELHPPGEALRPEGVPARPRCPGPQTAVVVGPDGQALWTDALGRIKVRFPWDRTGRGDERSSCWVRVSSPWAGNQLGAVQLPRIGQEVLVDFIGGNPDLPVCTGRVHNALNPPPWALPGQSALSGLRSRELTADGGNGAAGRSNHMVMDDTAGGLQVQLASDHQGSSLALGCLARIEDNAGRKDARGEGFELRTDAHGVLRAGDGMLVTTEARTRAAGHAKALTETAARLASAHERHLRLSDAAIQSSAQDAGDQEAVARVLKEQDEEIAGSHGETRSGSRDGADGAFPELSRPHLVFASAAGIASTATGSTHIASGAHTALTSGQHTSISAGRSLLASAREALRLFAAKAGMRLVAAGGNIDVTALQNAIHLLAKLEITQTAERITITAQKEVLINGGGSYSRWNSGGVTHGTQGAWTEHAGAHAQVGPDGLPVVSPSFPKTEFVPGGAFPASL